MVILFVTFIVILTFAVKFVSKTSLFHIIEQCYQSFLDRFYTYQFYKVPRQVDNQCLQQNQLYLKLTTYINSLPLLEDTDFITLFNDSKSNDILIHAGTRHGMIVKDRFLGAKVSWIHDENDDCWVLKMRKADKCRVLRSYLQHILSVADEIIQRRRSKDIMLFMNLGYDDHDRRRNGRWRSLVFNHPSTFETIVMDSELKNKVKSDLEMFLKSKHYYNRLGRVWKRSYMLYGESRSEKSSLIAAMARFLCYDVYYVNMGSIRDESDLMLLVLQTTPRSVIVVEDLDNLVMDKSLSTRVIERIIYCCAEERIMIFTMNNKDESVVIGSAQIDFEIEFLCCDFNTFKEVAVSCLGVKEHKLFTQVEEIFQHGSVQISPSEVADIMISNRSSNTRALRCVISAMQLEIDNHEERLRNRSGKVLVPVAESESGGLFCKENVNLVNDFKSLYGFLRVGSRRKDDSLDFDNSTHQEKLLKSSSR
ncbi:hypothetical protein ACFE04_028193 [Oxalis oulophora]